MGCQRAHGEPGLVQLLLMHDWLVLLPATYQRQGYPQGTTSRCF